MNKIKNLAQKYSAIALGVILGSGAAVAAFPAFATLDANNTAIASTTINTLTGTFTDYLLYVIPGVLVIFLIFWGFKFVLRWMRKFAH